jgi:hypothetical protein
MLTSRDAVIGFRSLATAVDFFNGLLGLHRDSISARIASADSPRPKDSPNLTANW